VLGLVFSPFLAGVALSVAGSEVRPSLRQLLSDGAGWYARLFRIQLVAVIPLGIAGALAAVAFAWASGASDRATSEAATHTSAHIAWLVSVGVVVLGQLVVDAGRARLVAEPARRSALFAIGAGVKLVVKRPIRALAIAAVSSALALVVAAVFLVLRQHIAQSSGAAVVLAFGFGQLAVASIWWGHAAKLCGLVEIARDLVASDRKPAPRSPDSE
jgi:hypothetical protein